jgi:4-azaleucine resistance transporter AzlC
MTGALQATPIVLGYVPIGLAFGVLAQKAGIAPAAALAMSVFVYAGSAQLIAVGMISAGASPLAIVLTTFVVNLRHLLMAAALSPYLRRWSRRALAVFAYELTDETFAVHVTRFAALPDEVPSRSAVLVTNATAQAAWLLGTGLGVALGSAIADVRPYGLDYALPAMFIALLVLQVKGRLDVLVALLAGALSVGLHLAGIQQWNVLAATVVGALLGALCEGWIERRSA